MSYWQSDGFCSVRSPTKRPAPHSGEPVGISVSYTHLDVYKRQSNYNALEVSVRHSIGGLELNAAYTYSHSIDDSSSANDAGLINTYALSTFRASSNFDQRHTVTLAYVYDVPLFKGQHTLAGKLLGGWQWSGITLLQSGTPFTVYNDGNGVIAPGDNAGVGNGLSLIHI